MGVELFDLDWGAGGRPVLLPAGLGAVRRQPGSVRLRVRHRVFNRPGKYPADSHGYPEGLSVRVPVYHRPPCGCTPCRSPLQGTIAAGLTGYGTSIGSVGQEIIAELGEIGSVTEMIDSSYFGLGTITSPIMILFCIILMAYAVIKVFFSNLKRGGILLIQIAVGSLYMFSIPRGYTDGFVQWIKQVIALCLTAFLQSTILVAGLLVFKDHALLGLGLMLSAGEVPRIAGAFGLDTTTSFSIRSAVYTAQAAVNTTRTLIGAVKP